MNSEKREEEDDEAATQGEGREKVTGPRRDPAPTSARRLGLKENTRHIYPIPYLLRLQSMAYARSLSLECPSTNAPWRRGSSCLTCAVGGHPPPLAPQRSRGTSHGSPSDQEATKQAPGPFTLSVAAARSRGGARAVCQPLTASSSHQMRRGKGNITWGGRGGTGEGRRRGVQTSPGPPRLHVAMQHV